MTTPRRNVAVTPKQFSYKHVFVDTLPDVLEEGVLYVCMQYATSAHHCFCGCGREVVTPIHPTKWKITYDGVNVSLYPSVGSWSLPCQSHYWLQEGTVSWAEPFNAQEIARVRKRDGEAQDKYFAKVDPPLMPKTSPAVHTPKRPGFWKKASDWILGK